ncbi:uncharacterized protein VTP21DRAFT_7217 [Calcarisporiella thermophila]|uniref:uncharacterized protein n=1 Tax=Calcarisporiella thermophila TaxID=911321 RepID=UPI0037426EA8
MPRLKSIRDNYYHYGEYDEHHYNDYQRLQPTKIPREWSKVIPVIAYCTSSILMTLTNKYMVSGTDFDMNFLLLSLQLLVTAVALETFKFFKLLEYRGFNRREAKRWLPITIFLVAMIYTGSKSLQYLHISIYTIFKNLTIILVAYGEKLLFGNRVTLMMLSSFSLMVLSSIIAGWSDLISGSNVYDASNGIRLTGYSWMFFNCLMSAAYVLIMRKRIKSTGFTDFDTVFYNSCIGVPIMLCLSMILEDWREENLIKNFPPELRLSLLFAIIFSGISAFAISYSSAWCVRATSSTTFSMAGALNKLPIAISGMILGEPITFGSISGVLVGFIAGLIYTLAKQRESSKHASVQKPSIQNSSLSRKSEIGFIVVPRPSAEDRHEHSSHAMR